MCGIGGGGGAWLTDVRYWGGGVANGCAVLGGGEHDSSQNHCYIMLSFG